MSAFGNDFFAEVHTVSFGQPNDITDRAMKILGSFTQLRELYLDSTHVTDAGLQPLRFVTQLEWLRLDNTRIRMPG